MKTIHLLAVACGAALVAWSLSRRSADPEPVKDSLYQLPATLENAATRFTHLGVPEAIYLRQLELAKSEISSGAWYPEETYTPVVDDLGNVVGEVDVWGGYRWKSEVAA